jgi:hypothetical protein
MNVGKTIKAEAEIKAKAEIKARGRSAPFIL